MVIYFKNIGLERLVRKAVFELVDDLDEKGIAIN
jgi:hypothetical protein